jgi:hypothetical protein
MFTAGRHLDRLAEGWRFYNRHGSWVSVSVLGFRNRERQL